MKRWILCLVLVGATAAAHSQQPPVENGNRSVMSAVRAATGGISATTILGLAAIVAAVTATTSAQTEAGTTTATTTQTTATGTQ